MNKKFGIKLPRAHKRLETLYEEVVQLADSDDVITDVGTDHGYLPVMLAKTNKYKKLIATDISKPSLQKAHELTQKYGVNVECRVCDGLANAKETTLAVMAGIGGNEIIKILQESGYHGKMILQPVPTAIDLRRYLLENNYKIEKDYVFCDENKFYFVFVVNGFGKNKYSKLDIALGPVKKQKTSQDFIKFVKAQINKLKFLENFDITNVTNLSKKEIKEKQQYYKQLKKLLEKNNDTRNNEISKN